MIYTVFLLILLIFSNYKFNKDSIFIEYLEKNNTTLINGIFIALVFLSHFSQYVKYTNPLDKPYILMSQWMGQLVVTMFLFYSGYGIMESIKNKGVNYITSIPKNRILKTLLHFNLALFFYYIIRVLNHQVPPIATTVQSMFAFRSLGNSDWYIFGILCLWSITYLVYYFFVKLSYLEKTVIISALVIVLCVALYFFKGKAHWWYDTLLCYPLGMYWSITKDKINKYLSNNKMWCIVTFFALFLIIISTMYKKNVVFYEVRVLTFTMAVVLLSMKVTFKSQILSWMGGNLFEIYILMRLPMMLLKKHFIGHNYWYLFTTIVITYFMVIAFKYCLRKLDNRLFVKG